MFPKVLAQNCDDFNCNNTIYNADQVCHPHVMFISSQLFKSALPILPSSSLPWQKKSGSVRRHMTSYLSHEVKILNVMNKEEMSPGEHVHNRSFDAGLRRSRLPPNSSLHRRSLCQGDDHILSFKADLALQVGRNITRAFWDYYKIVAVIPLEVGGTPGNVTEPTQLPHQTTDDRLHSYYI